MVNMTIFNIQRAITLKVGKQDLYGSVVFCMPSHSVSSFMKICQAVLKLWSGHKNCTQTHTHKIENYIPHCMHTS